MSFMPPMHALDMQFGAMQAKLMHDQRVETFRPDDVQLASAEREPQETMGTTILACTFENGVVLASDTVTSSGTLIVDYAAPKITSITDHIWMLRSGNAADTRMISKIVQKYVRALEIQLGGPVPVSTAARLVQQIVFYNKGALLAGIIVAGWDEQKGPQVYSITPDGATAKSNYAMGGSGSTFILGWADSTFKLGMSEAECKEWLKNAVAHAKARDGSSGMNTRMTVVTKDGATQSFHAWDESPYRMEFDPNHEKLQDNLVPN